MTKPRKSAPPSVLVLTRDERLLRLIELAVAEIRPLPAVSRIELGAEFLQALQLLRPALAVLDDGADDMDGQRLLAAARGRNDRVPLVFLAPEHSPDLERDSRSLGVFAYFSRPIEEERFTHVIQAALRLRG